ncbi:hypothetical protein [Streptomyces lydicus]|uniref:hypothetical protein n=1 Tax=Streptomyces lydicus TaxID=47763 RepID=UPI0036DFB90F
MNVECSPLMEADGYVAEQDEWGEYQQVQDSAGWEQEIEKYVRDEDRTHPDLSWVRRTGKQLAEAAIERLNREAAQAEAGAVAALPPADQPLPILTTWQYGLLSDGRRWAERVAPLVFRRWTADPTDEARDHVIVWAHKAEISKAEIYRATGVARTTIDGILARHEERDAAADRSH